MKDMKIERITIAVTLACATSLASAADWSDTWISYKHQESSREIANANKIAKDTIGFTHVSGYKYGSNFLNVDAIKSDSCDPAAIGSTATAPTKCAGVQGAQEVYITYRTNLEYGKIGGKPLAFGPLKDIALTVGFDLNDKNTTNASNKRMWVLGPTFMVNLDKGFFNVGTFMSQETNRNALAGNGRDKTFDIAPMLSMSWNLPFQVGLPAKFQGFFNVVGEKGAQYGGENSAIEYFSRSSVMLDVGSGLGMKNNTVWAGVGYEYWRNKFGNEINKSTGGTNIGTRVYSPMALLEWHF